MKLTHRLFAASVGISHGPSPPSPGDPLPLDDVAAIVLNAKGFIAWVVTDPTGGSTKMQRIPLPLLLNSRRRVLEGR